MELLLVDHQVFSTTGHTARTVDDNVAGARRRSWSTSSVSRSSAVWERICWACCSRRASTVTCGNHVTRARHQAFQFTHRRPQRPHFTHISLADTFIVATSGDGTTFLSDIPCVAGPRCSRCCLRNLAAADGFRTRDHHCGFRVRHPLSHSIPPSLALLQWGSRSFRQGRS